MKFEGRAHHKLVLTTTTFKGLVYDLIRWALDFSRIYFEDIKYKHSASGTQ